jgi:predicted nucleotidyltransferase
MAKNISIPTDKIEDFCRRNHILKLSLFGSVLRDDFTPGSDVDVLVEFESSARVGFFELYDIEQQLSSLLGGRKIDMNTPQGLSKYFRDKVVTTAEAQYVRS